jgi:hypothetical protein
MREFQGKDTYFTPESRQSAARGDSGVKAERRLYALRAPDGRFLGITGMPGEVQTFGTYDDAYEMAGVHGAKGRIFQIVDAPRKIKKPVGK